MFGLAELNAAHDAWSLVTGLDASTAEWGEVLAALDDCGLLDVDRPAPRTLFDTDEADIATASPENAAAVLRTSVALVSSAHLAQAHPVLSPATCVEIMTVLLDRFHPNLTEEWFAGYDEVLGIKAARRVQAIADSPAAALTWLVQLDGGYPDSAPDWLSPVLALLLDLAQQDDALAERFFDQLTSRVPGAGYEYGLAPLCDGRWLVFSTTAQV